MIVLGHLGKDLGIIQISANNNIQMTKKYIKCKFIIIVN